MRTSIVVFSALLAVVAVSGAAPPKSGEEDRSVSSDSQAVQSVETAAVPQPQKRQLYGGHYNPYGYMGMGHMMGMGYSRMGMGIYGRKRREASPTGAYGGWGRGGYGGHMGGYGGHMGGYGGHMGGYGGGRWGRKRRDLSDVTEYNPETEADQEDDFDSQSESERSKRQMWMGGMNRYNMGMGMGMPYYNNYY